MKTDVHSSKTKRRTQRSTIDFPNKWSYDDSTLSGPFSSVFRQMDKQLISMSWNGINVFLQGYMYIHHPLLSERISKITTLQQEYSVSRQKKILYTFIYFVSELNAIVQISIFYLILETAAANISTAEYNEKPW